MPISNVSDESLHKMSLKIEDLKNVVQEIYYVLLNWERELELEVGRRDWNAQKEKMGVKPKAQVPVQTPGELNAQTLEFLKKLNPQDLLNGLKKG